MRLECRPFQITQQIAERRLQRLAGDQLNSRKNGRLQHPAGIIVVQHPAMRLAAFAAVLRKPFVNQPRVVLTKRRERGCGEEAVDDDEPAPRQFAGIRRQVLRRKAQKGWIDIGWAFAVFDEQSALSQERALPRIA